MAHKFVEDCETIPEKGRYTSNSPISMKPEIIANESHSFWSFITRLFSRVSVLAPYSSDAAPLFSKPGRHLVLLKEYYENEELRPFIKIEKDFEGRFISVTEIEGYKEAKEKLEASKP